MSSSTKFLNFDNVLCLSPHPDDVEYAMLGSALKFKETKFDIVCMTRGGKFDSTVSDYDRLDEIKSLWSSSKAENVNLFFTKFNHISDMDEDSWINFIENSFMRESRYDGILIPSNEDSHFEHRKVSKLGFALIRSSLISLVEYATPSALQTWNPNFFVDVSENIIEKKKLLRHFISQREKMYFDDATIDGFHTDFQCMKRGMKNVEKFRILNFYQR